MRLLGLYPLPYTGCQYLCVTVTRMNARHWMLSVTGTRIISRWLKWTCLQVLLLHKWVPNTGYWDIGVIIDWLPDTVTRLFVIHWILISRCSCYKNDFQTLYVDEANKSVHRKYSTGSGRVMAPVSPEPLAESIVSSAPGVWNHQLFSCGLRDVVLPTLLPWGRVVME